MRTKLILGLSLVGVAIADYVAYRYSSGLIVPITVSALAAIAGFAAPESEAAKASRVPAAGDSETQPSLATWMFRWRYISSAVLAIALGALALALPRTDVSETTSDTAPSSTAEEVVTTDSSAVPTDTNGGTDTGETSTVPSSSTAVAPVTTPDIARPMTPDLPAAAAVYVATDVNDAARYTDADPDAWRIVSGAGFDVYAVPTDLAALLDETLTPEGLDGCPWTMTSHSGTKFVARSECAGIWRRGVWEIIDGAWTRTLWIDKSADA